MYTLKNGLILSLFFTCTMLYSCGGTANSNQSNSASKRSANAATDDSNSPKTNAEELGLLINMPYETQEIVWKEDRQHKKVIAVLRFSPENSKKIVAEAAKIMAPEKVTISTEPWFPPELIAQGEQSGEDSVNGLAYSAGAFFQPPYTEGRITRVEASDYFVLEVSAR